MADSIETSGVAGEISPALVDCPVPSERMGEVAAALAPVAESRRIFAVDTLRGVAVLGILAMNITTFGLPMASYMNPAAAAVEPYAGPFAGANLVAWAVTHIFFDMKMMTIFSMLFGAGLVLMGGEGREAGGESGGRREFAWVYYRRLGWLFLIGLIHAYIIWYGDILTTYALCGLVLYPLRKLPPRAMIAIGVVLASVAMVTSAGFGAMFWWFDDMTREARAALEAGNELTAAQADLVRQWHEANAGFDPTAAKVAEEIAQVRGPMGAVVQHNIENALFFQTLLFISSSFWRCTGGMLIGMALMKLGVFSASRSKSFYLKLAACGYGLGLPLVLVGAVSSYRGGFNLVDWFLIDSQWNYVGSFGVALGHVAVVMLIVQAGVMKRIVGRLAAVGRMALTNYLSQSVIGAAVFFGWGLGLFASLTRWQLVLSVLVVWGLQLTWSKWWLARFRFGPAEWVWRSLTYWKRQPMRRGRPESI